MDEKLKRQVSECDGINGIEEFEGVDCDLKLQQTQYILRQFANPELHPFIVSGRDIFEKYQCGESLGGNEISEVRLAIHRQLGVLVAVKRAKTRKMTKNEVEDFINEADLLYQLNHPNILAFIDLFIS